MKIEVQKYFAIGIIISMVFFGCSENKPIDREALVTRHKVHANKIDSLCSLSVGNGKFATTVDFTGLQTFPEIYERGIPLGTMSEWGWHSFPSTENYKYEETLREYDFHGRKVPYSVQINEPERNRDAVNYFRQNLHRLHLGLVGLELSHPDGSNVLPSEISEIDQTLNPWTGEILSSFKVDNKPVEVITYAHQELDLISAKIKSPLIAEGQLKIKLSFAYPSGGFADSGCDWRQESKHTSTIENSEPGEATIFRKIDDSEYSVKTKWSGKTQILEERVHHFIIQPDNQSNEFTFSCYFGKKDYVNEIPEFEATAQNSIENWKTFWESGGAVDFSGSTDPRAIELERRVVLSQYLTKIQCEGMYPPQETGLTYNSWYGKPHLEMHWWHGSHYALWDREQLLEKSLGWYETVADKARATAQRQGFKGVRWQKMTDPTGNDSPSGVGSFLIWQQPNYIYLSEMCYRNNQSPEFLKQQAGLVFETADFMASYAYYDSVENRYFLGPYLIPAQERLPKETTINPPFEVIYWIWGLSTAQQWLERLGMEKNEEWDKVINGFYPIAQKDGLYLAAESAPDSYTNPRYMSDHPIVIGAHGMLPGGTLVDPALMKQTFDYVWDNWHWEETWGWDFPLTAMAATRLGMPGKAIDALFMDIQTNTYLPNGHNYQDERLRLYLPGNGGLLSAIAMMCAGFDGSKTDTPGFPKDGSWNVKWEGLKKMP